MNKLSSKKRMFHTSGYRPSRANFASEVIQRLRTLFAITGALLLIGLCLISSQCYAGDAVPLDDPTYDWFKLGSNVGVILDHYWNGKIDHASTEPYQRISELMTKLHVTESTLRSFQTWQTQVQNLQWTSNADAAYTEARSQALTWYTSLKNQATSEARFRFFFLLGYHSGKITREGGLEEGREGGYARPLIAEDVATFRDAASDFQSLATASQYEKIFAPLNEYVRKLIEQVGSYRSTLTTAPASLTMHDVLRIVEACEDIKNTGNHGNTFYPPPGGGEWLPQEAPLFL
jgi:hypothetical protein